MSLYYASLNNSGATWTTNSAPHLVWNSITCSSDGTKLAASVNGGGIYTSTNSGTTWTQQTNAPNANLVSIASSADGNKLVACVLDGGLIYNSTNAGATWTSNSVPNWYWNSVASSADGNILVAAGTYNQICVSTNSGNTWQSRVNFSPPAAVNPEWHSVACSADGTKMVAMCSYYSSFPSFSILASTNSGTSWKIVSAINQNWKAVASSADGKEFVAVSGGVYISQTVPTPQLNLVATNDSLTLSWIVPSTNFVLQQSSDLQNWTNTAITPMLNLTNLQEQVILSPTNGSGFYRLKTP
jgi:photosystem II stability/assembly factor-like uncharacterized protein